VAVIGTTDIRVPDPEHYGIEAWEVELMLDEGEKLVPGIKDMRVLRAWAGVRPLYQEKAAGVDTRDVSRTYTLLDHETRDNVRGFLTITGGKWTTYRQMAQVVADAVCQKLGVERPCRTAEEPCPNPENSSEGRLFWIGAPLAKIEAANAWGRLVCECELVERGRIEKAIVEGGATSLDDIRRDNRMGMGPCQGGFCTYRAASILHELRQPDVTEINAALRDFLQERWKGLTSILWGDQLKQARLDELIYLSLMNVELLPISEQRHPLAAFPPQGADDFAGFAEPAILPRKGRHRRLGATGKAYYIHRLAPTDAAFDNAQGQRASARDDAELSAPRHRRQRAAAISGRRDSALMKAMIRMTSSRWP
jgi:glycerol-3-phosphate dehydrogenase